MSDEVLDAKFFADNGDGSFTVMRSKNNNCSSNEVVNKIMIAIFENNPHVNEISILN